MMERPHPSARCRCLDVAERLVESQGAARLTLDAVAKAAGVSKGGLLYHFPSKEALLAGMIQRHVSELDALASQLQGPPDSGVGLLQSYVQALLQAAPGRASASGALLAAVATEPSLLGVCRAHQARILEPFERTPSLFKQASLVLMSAYGLSLCEAMQISPLTLAQRHSAVQELITRASACDANAFAGQGILS